MHKFEKFERWLVRFVILGLVALVVVQALMTQDPFRFYLSFAERLDGKKLENIEPSQTTLAPIELDNPEQTTEKKNTSDFVTLEITDFSSLQKANILLNGQIIADFREKWVTVPVRTGDILAIDGSFYRQPFTVIVRKVSPHLQYPKVNQVIKIEQNLVQIGEIKDKKDPDS